MNELSEPHAPKRQAGLSLAIQVPWLLSRLFSLLTLTSLRLRTLAAPWAYATLRSCGREEAREASLVTSHSLGGPSAFTSFINE